MPAPVLQPHQLVSLTRAARALPMRDADARRLLQGRGLVADVAGRQMVVWWQVVAALAAKPGTPAAPVVRRPECAERAHGGDDEQDMKGWPRTVAVDVADGSQVKAEPMKARGGRVYWKVRRCPGQMSVSVARHTASGTGWATRPEMIQAIMSVIIAEQNATAHAQVPQPDALGGFTRAVATSGAPWTVAEMVDEHLDRRERFDGLRPRTVRQYHYAADRIRDRMGDVRVVDLDEDMIERFAAGWMKEKGVTTRAVVNVFAVLRPALQWAIKKGRTPRQTMPDVPKLKYTPTKTSRPPERAELRRVLAVLSKAAPEVERALRLQAMIGVRIGDAVSLRWRDVQKKRVRIKGRPVERVAMFVPDGKTGHRAVPCKADTVAHLERMRELAGEPGLDSKIIGDALAGPDSSSLSRHISVVLGAAGLIGQFRPNMLRALFGNELIRSGISPTDDEAIMGHSIEAAQRHYLE